MPSILSKHKALDGEVIQYAERSGYYYRSYSKETRRYTLKLIAGAETVEDALANAYKALQPISDKQSDPAYLDRVKKALKPTVDIANEIEEWLRYSERNVVAGLKAENAHKRRCIVLRKHLIDYLKLKGITKPREIEEITFDDYGLFRSGIARSTLKTELKEIQTFIRYWLTRHKHLSVEVGLSPTLIPKVKLRDADLLANPSISPHDYRLINEHIRKEWISGAAHSSSLYFRHMFHTFTHLLKNSGCRPIEILNLRFKDLTITNPKRWSDSQQQWVNDWKLELWIAKSKTGKPRTVYCRSNAADNMIKFLEYQKQYMSTEALAPLTKDKLVFGKPSESFFKTYSHRYLDDTWAAIINSLKGELEGSKHSEHRYTLYSLRTTFIEDCVADGIDVYTVAKLCGNTVKTIERYYDKSDLMRKQEQIQSIARGKRKPPAIETLDPLNHHFL